MFTHFHIVPEDSLTPTAAASNSAAAAEEEVEEEAASCFKTELTGWEEDKRCETTLQSDF